MNETKKLGQRGEHAVARWLQQFGYTILSLNFQTRLGEIDIIASKEETLAFVEVKTRKTTYFPISNTVTRSKQQKLIKTAQQFVLKNKFTDKVLRFDVATVTPENDQCKITYIKNAFQR